MPSYSTSLANDGKTVHVHSKLGFESGTILQATKRSTETAVFARHREDDDHAQNETNQRGHLAKRSPVTSQAFSFISKNADAAQDLLTPLKVNDGKLSQSSPLSSTLSEGRLSDSPRSSLGRHGSSRYDADRHPASPSSSRSYSPRGGRSLSPSDNRGVKWATQAQESQLERVQQLGLDVLVSNAELRALVKAPLGNTDELKVKQIQHRLLDAQYAAERENLLESATRSERADLKKLLNTGVPRWMPDMTPPARPGRPSLPVPHVPLPPAGRPSLWKETSSKQPLN